MERLCQNARRLDEESANCFDRVCRSPQKSTPAKSTNIATTKMVTSNESVGMRLISSDGETMPAMFRNGFEVDQILQSATPNVSCRGDGGGPACVQETN